MSGGLTIDYAQAATKSPKLNTSSMTIPIGKMGKDVSWFDSNRNYTTAVPLSVENKVKGATYTFTSSNTKVVKISKKGGYLTGVKKGSAKITCKQTYKNKTTVVGTCKVTIKNTAIEKETWDMCLGEDLFNIEYVGLEYYSRYDKYYYFWFDNKYSDIIKFVSDDEGYKRIQGLKAGTAVVKLYEDSLEGRYIGQYKVIVEGNTEEDNNNNNDYGGVVFN